ncbi:SDR family NAD(P)-dependent oxidoreductase [Engelhardtia mirabilis]|uniref:Putative oxidoreductase n=1 Tax=Engelhardtia mirabilis TaxID=2528011 RepID=A0A518BDA5_9BACT|nr:putative oxidoreductase [Planctomycetes bacterium Pla133]QDU99287.1 putative oxidoreductase [Planctomycetes bacterium Pla86]
MSAGRRALITGASSGIGAATALVLARAGYRVALLARRSDALESVAAGLPPPPTGAHLTLIADVRDEQQLRTALARVHAAFGGLDLLVNNAGIGYRARVEELEVERVRALIDTNVVGLLVACREALPLLRHGVRPVVVNVSSVVGRRGIPGQSVYAASKAAVCSISEALRIEWADEGIAVTNLEPALTATGFFEAQANPGGLPDPDLSDAAGPEEVAEEVLALDRRPRPEVNLRWKWRLLAALSVLAPRLSDRLLVRRLGGDWRVPRR